MPPSFSIQAAAERSGLTPHVIRAWERRYGAIEPARTLGRHRLYSEEEVERLSMLNRAVRSGHSIGKIARLSVEDLRSLTAVAPHHSGAARHDPAAGFRAQAVDAITRFDAPGLEHSLEAAVVGFGHQGFLQLVVAPLAEEIGDRWRSGTLTAAHEHFFTATVRSFLGETTRQFATPLNAPRIVVATPVGQLHELGAVMAAAAAANLGWRPIYLGTSLPAPEIAGAAKSNEAVAVALSIVYPEDDPNVAAELTSLAGLLPVHTRLLAGGRGARAYFDTLVRIGALYADSLDAFGLHLDRLRQGARSGP